MKDTFTLAKGDAIWAPLGDAGWKPAEVVSVHQNTVTCRYLHVEQSGYAAFTQGALRMWWRWVEARDAERAETRAMRAHVKSSRGKQRVAS